jgi:vanillate O-demethylase ferredoxin subunit
MMTGPLNVRLVRKALEAEGICSFELAAADGAALPAFAAGAHIDVHLPGGPVRQYSLCSDPRDTTRYLVAVLAEPDGRGGSRAMHALAEGALLGISRPRNHFPIAPQARNHLLVAGGIGITPLLCMAEQLARDGADFELHYCVRSTARAAFVERLQQAPFAHRVRVHADDGPAAQRLDLLELFDGAERGTHLYLCGPAGFIGMVAEAARAYDLGDEQIHVELFGAPPATAAPSGGAFDIRLAGSSRTLTVAPGQSALECLEAHGIQVPVSCRQGVCGSCLTTVLEGEPEHRDFYLTDAERARGDCFLPCCSRAHSPLLVLDL